MNFLRALRRLFSQTIRELIADDVPMHGAALAFYAALSLAPMLVIALKAASVFYGEEAARGELMRQMQELLGEQGSRAVQDVVASGRHPAAGFWSTIVGAGVLLFGASSVFAQLQSSLNLIWKVHSQQSRGFWHIVRDRFLSFAMVLCICVLLVLSLVTTAVTASLETLVDRIPGHWERTWAAVNGFGASWAIITLLFAAMFKILPDARVRWRDVWLGAAVTSLLFNLGKLLIGWYLGYSSFTSSYGLAGSFVALLFWVYYSSQIVYFGAELTQVYAQQLGVPIVRRAMPIAARSGGEGSSASAASPAAAKPAPPRTE